MKGLRAGIVVTQIVTYVVAYLLAAVFAPRVLLLGPAETEAAQALILMNGAVTGALSLAVTIVLLRRLRSLGAAARDPLDDGPLHASGTEALRLYLTPSHVIIVNISFLSLSFATFLPPLRPQALDAYSQLALVLLSGTMVATAMLAGFVRMRTIAARTLEHIVPETAREALRQPGRSALGLVKQRYVAAVTAPVAVVALGASLLADAHTRAYDKEARAQDAIDVAHAVFEPFGGGGSEEMAGRNEAIEAAAAVGFHIQIVPGEGDVEAVRHGDEGETQVAVPLPPSSVLVRFDTRRVSAAFAAYLLLALAAVALAGLLGTRASNSFISDVALATREIRQAGVAQVMRGTIILHEARFSNVAALLDAIDALGGVFREFASAQRRAIDAREATERMRGLLLASMSHDLKAPLNAVLGFTELVRRNPLTKEQLESLAIIEQRGRELLVLIDTILDSARVEAGELQVSPTSTSIDDVVMSAVLEARDLALGSAVQIAGEVQPGIPLAMLDGTRIVQALTAVVMTATRFSDKGNVTVRAMLGDHGEQLRIDVETSGEGLSPQEREKIFDAFRSAESARRQGGLGLGLQLARSIVEIHDGTIEVDYAAHGGTVFRIGLPLETDQGSITIQASTPHLEE